MASAYVAGANAQFKDMYGGQYGMLNAYTSPVAQASEQAKGAIGAAQAQAAGNAAAGRYAGMGTAEAGRFGALGGLATAMSQDNANRYGAYQAAEASRQQAMANEASNRYAAYGMAEAARQTALGNLGSSAIGAYGSNANQAMQAWSQNQQAFNSALAAMQGSSQGALSNYGSSRNAAIGQLGSAAAGASAARDISATLPGGGGGFTASNPYGTVASGSYDIYRQQPGGYSADPTGQFGQMLMSGDLSSQLDRNASRGLDMLQSQHLSSREMPSRMQAQTFGDLLMMGNQYIAPTMAGMDQFYAHSAAFRPDFSSGMNQFYGNMAAAAPDYSGVLGVLSQKSDFGSAPAAAGMFGDAMVASSDLGGKIQPFDWAKEQQSYKDKIAYERFVADQMPFTSETERRRIAGRAADYYTNELPGDAYRDAAIGANMLYDMGEPGYYDYVTALANKNIDNSLRESQIRKSLKMRAGGYEL